MNKEKNITNMLNRSSKVIGLRQVLRGISEGTIRCVIVSNDADSDLKERLVKEATSNNIEILYAPSMAWLGKSVDVDVKTATVGILSLDA